jgi:hypothetical protein
MERVERDSFAVFLATMRRLRFSLVVPATVLAATALPSPRAAGVELPPGKQAILIGRIVAYDGHLEARAGAAVNIAVLAKKGDKDSERMAGYMVKAFTPLESAKLLGLPLHVSRLDFSGREALDRAIRDGGIDTLYVCSGLDASLADIKAVARARKVLTVGSHEDHLRSGLAIGVFLIEGKNTILVNLEASRAEGVVFSPELLRLATIVR